MTGPKHLWSGDWESESARTAESLPSAPAPEPEPEPQPAATRRWSRRQMVIALTTGVAAAAITVALVTTLAGPNRTRRPPARAASHTATNPKLPTGGQAPINACQQNPNSCTQATPVVSGPTADWLGMQIVTSPAGIVISAIRLGSLADQAGFEPGDQVAQIDGHHIDSVDQIRQDTSRIALGRLVTIQVLRASSIPQAASVPMTERPTIHP